jgi:hypothetical protein
VIHTVPADACHDPAEQVPACGPSSQARPGPRAAQRKFHAEDPQDPSRCTCGYAYPARRRGGHPILLAATCDAITSKAAAVVPFTRIAEQTGLSVHTVRWVVHR